MAPNVGPKHHELKNPENIFEKTVKNSDKFA
jgi:hypothetical protein